MNLFVHIFYIDKFYTLDFNLAKVKEFLSEKQVI